MDDHIMQLGPDEVGLMNVCDVTYFPTLPSPDSSPSLAVGPLSVADHEHGRDHFGFAASEFDEEEFGGMGVGEMEAGDETAGETDVGAEDMAGYDEARSLGLTTKIISWAGSATSATTPARSVLRTRAQVVGAHGYRTALAYVRVTMPSLRVCWPDASALACRSRFTLDLDECTLCTEELCLRWTGVTPYEAEDDDMLAKPSVLREDKVEV
jgi:hypothetical protein